MPASIFLQVLSACRDSLFIEKQIYAFLYYYFYLVRI